MRELREELVLQAKERNDRLRDNKRRYRSRKKGYVVDLERRLAEVRQEGVQATKEVQLSAQKVIRENGRLRALLRHLGTGEDVVEMWVNGGAACHPPAPESSKPAKEAVPAAVFPVRVPSQLMAQRYVTAQAQTEP